jgi:hypothetical protein
MNLTHLAVAMDDETDIQLRYRRLQRFFQVVHFDYDAIAHLIMQIFGFNTGSFYLTLDRINWKGGKKHFNLLVLAVAYKGAAIPIYWLVLNKQGNSNKRERRGQLSRFIDQFGSASIQGVLGDREFIGKHWWGWLSDQMIPF